MERKWIEAGSGEGKKGKASHCCEAKLRDVNLAFPLPFVSSHPILKAPHYCAAASPAPSSPPSLPANLAAGSKLAMNHATKEIVVFVAGVDNAPEIPVLSGTHDPARACAYGIFYDSTRFNSFNTSHRRHVLPESELYAQVAVWRVSRPPSASWLDLTSSRSRATGYSEGRQRFSSLLQPHHRGRGLFRSLSAQEARPRKGQEGAHDRKAPRRPDPQLCRGS